MFHIRKKNCMQQFVSGVNKSMELPIRHRFQPMQKWTSQRLCAMSTMLRISKSKECCVLIPAFCILYLENDYLDLPTRMIPLQSSHTMSGDELVNKGGAPEKSDKEKSDRTRQNEESM